MSSTPERPLAVVVTGKESSQVELEMWQGTSQQGGTQLQSLLCFSRQRCREVLACAVVYCNKLRSAGGVCLYLKGEPIFNCGEEVFS